MPMDDVFGGLRRLLSEFFNEAREPDGLERLERLHAAAVEHGRFRRAQACSHRVLAQDFAALNAAIGETLRRNGMSASLAADCLVILGPSLGAVSDAALLGWMGE